MSDVQDKDLIEQGNRPFINDDRFHAAEADEPEDDLDEEDGDEDEDDDDLDDEEDDLDDEDEEDDDQSGKSGRSSAAFFKSLRKAHIDEQVRKQYDQDQPSSQRRSAR